MIDYKSATNIELYESRIEPTILKNSEGEYVNLRTCEDPGVLEGLEKELSDASSGGASRIAVPWLSPPYNRIVGYGVYTREQARLLSRRSSKENWGFPRFGRSYGSKEIKKLIDSCAEPSLP